MPNKIKIKSATMNSVTLCGPGFRIVANPSRIGPDDIKPGEGMLDAVKRNIGETVLFNPDEIKQKGDYIESAFRALTKGYGIRHDSMEWIIFTMQLREGISDDTPVHAMHRTVFINLEKDIIHVEPFLNTFLLARRGWEYVAKSTVTQIIKKIRNQCGKDCINLMCPSRLIKGYAQMCV